MLIPIQITKYDSGLVKKTELDNMYFEDGSLVPSAGIALFTELEEKPLTIKVFQNNLFVITKSKLLKIETDGTIIVIGSVNIFSENISVATSEKFLVFVDGFRGYYYNETGLKEFSGDGWYPASHVCYVGGYFVFNRVGTGQFFVSDLLSVELDPIKWATAEALPDNISALISDHSELILFGDFSIEFWSISGSADFPFSRMGTYMNKGIFAPNSIVQLDNSIFWLGHDRIVYKAISYQPVRISSHAIEAQITKEDQNACAFGYSENGHIFYILHLPSKQKYFCFDVSSGLWHCQSIDLNCLTEYNQQWFAGVKKNNNIYIYSDKIYLNHTDIISRTMISESIGSENKFIQAVSLKVVFSYKITGSVILQWHELDSAWCLPIQQVIKNSTEVIFRKLGRFQNRRFKIEVLSKDQVIIKEILLEVK